MRQRKLEQKRYEKLIARELKKPIDDMALNDLKPLPTLPPVANLNIPGQAYADLLMVQEFIHSFGHVIDIGKPYVCSLDLLYFCLLTIISKLHAHRSSKCMSELDVHFRSQSLFLSVNPA